jgi:hypothetical protein
MRRCFIKVLGFLLAIGLGLWLSGNSAFASSSVSAYSVPLFSDFDGDNKVDQAELLSNGTQKRIHVSLGTFVWKFLSFDPGLLERGSLVSRDIDSDGDTDLVWVSENYPRTFVTWLGDGRGNFELAPESEQQLRRLKSLLWNDAELRLTGKTDGPGSVCILLTTSLAAYHNTVAFQCSVPSLKRSFSGSETPGDSVPLLSVIRKRGPPSRLS